MQNRCFVNGCFLNNSSNAHAHYLLTKMILRNFISQRAFTVYVENSNWPKWNLHRSEFQFAWTHMNVNKKITLHRSEILPGSEILNRFKFTSGLM